MKKGNIIKFGTYPQEVEEQKKSLIEELKQIFYKQPPIPKKQLIQFLNMINQVSFLYCLLSSLYRCSYNFLLHSKLFSCALLSGCLKG